MFPNSAKGFADLGSDEVAAPLLPHLEQDVVLQWAKVVRRRQVVGHLKGKVALVATVVVENFLEIAHEARLENRLGTEVLENRLEHLPKKASPVLTVGGRPQRWRAPTHQHPIPNGG